MSLLLCARHAAVAVTNRCYGRLDLPPGEDPRASASRLSLALPRTTPLAVWTSPLRRCREVADELARLLKAVLRIDDRLAEIDFGEWEGRGWNEIERRDRVRYEAWLTSWRDVGPPGGESLVAFEGRVRAWAGERGAHGDIETLALVGHAGVIRALRVLGAGATWDEALHQPIPHLEWLALPIARDSHR